MQIDEQILTLARAYQLPSEALSLRLSLLSSLQLHLRSSYPSSLLLPFGSTVLGLATPSSDLDTTLVLEPSVDDKFFFIESDYLSAFGQTASAQGMKVAEQRTSDQFWHELLVYAKVMLASLDT